MAGKRKQRKGRTSEQSIDRRGHQIYEKADHRRGGTEVSHQVAGICQFRSIFGIRSWILDQSPGIAGEIFE